MCVYIYIYIYTHQYICEVWVIHNYNSLTMIMHKHHVLQSTAVIENNQTNKILGNRDFFQL